jgi:hypothetical protein
MQHFYECGHKRKICMVFFGLRSPSPPSYSSPERIPDRTPPAFALSIFVPPATNPATLSAMTIPALLAVPTGPVQLSARARTGPSGRSRPRSCGPRLHGHGTTFGQMGRLPLRRELTGRKLYFIICSLCLL